MTCPAKITIAGVDYPCTKTDVHIGYVRGTSDGRHRTQVNDQVVHWPEDVAPPERDIPAGQIVMDATGNRYTRRKPTDPHYVDYPWSDDGIRYRDVEVIRPLTFLVPEPDPVDLAALVDLMLDISRRSSTATQDARAVVEHLGLQVKP